MDLVLAASIPPGGLRRHVEHRPVLERPQQLNVLRMRPGERHCASRRAAKKQLPLRYIFGVPYLFGYQAAFAARSFHCRKQPPRFFDLAESKFVVSALARKKWP